MDPGMAEEIEGLTVERYAEVTARLDLASAEARPRGRPAEEEARRAVLRELGVAPEVWARVHAGFQGRMTQEVSQSTMRSGLPPQERFPLIGRYGGAYAAEKKRLYEAQQRATEARGGGSPSGQGGA